MNNLKTMVVDDEPIIAKTTSLMLEKMVFLDVVAVEHNGEDGLKRFSELQPDLVITDVVMPVMTGIEMIGKIKQIKPDTECVIMSGYSEFEYAQKAIKLGIRDYILKPIDENELRTLIEDIRKKSNCKIKESVEKENAEKRLYSQISMRIQKMPKDSYGKIFNEIKLIFIQLEESEATPQLMNLVLKQISERLDIEEIKELSGNYKTVFESLMLNIKRKAGLRSDLAASEVVDLIEDDIRNNYHDDISSSHILEEYGYNEVYLANIFKQQKGISPKQLLQQTRINKAKEIIRLNSRIMLKDVAEMVGYTDQLYFSRIFKEQVGENPREYAKHQEDEKKS